MRQLILKPVLVAGFSFLAVPPLAAQNYIDVEAERQAERRARAERLATEQPASPPVSADSPVVVTPQFPESGTQSTGQSSDYGGTIRPYSGTTRMVTPIDAGAPQVSVSPAAAGDLVVKLQQLEADVRRLNGLVEEQAAALRRLEQQSLERYVDLDRRLAGGVVSSDPAAGASQDRGPGPTLSSNTPAAGGADAQPGEQAAYQAAYDLVRNRQFAPALEAFQGFLLDYPFGQFAPNAHYWLGELYLVIDPPDPELARQSFKLLLDQYPDHPKVPDALFKLGRVHYLKGNRDRSREYLDRVIARYGDEGHPAAQLARDFISQNF